MSSPQEFERLHAGVRDLQAADFKHAAALATITRTWGSTFRNAGTSMLVNADGRVVCALSGGCPQNDIVMRAQRVIANDQPEIARYDNDSGLDVLIEMGCGGQLEVLIEPLVRAADAHFLDAIANIQESRAGGFVATAFANGASPLSPRPQRLVWSGDIRHNDSRDSTLTDSILQIGTNLPAGARSIVRSIEIPKGTVEVLFEILRPTHALTVVGVNAASVALAQISCVIGWKTVLVDHRIQPDGAAYGAGIPAGVKLLQATPESLKREINLDRFSSVVVMTFNVERDIAYLNSLGTTSAAYIGAIGSRERARQIRAAFDVDGAHIHVPAGLDVGSETPEEIAVAVSAEILATLNARTGGSLSKSGGTNHP